MAALNDPDPSNPIAVEVARLIEGYTKNFRAHVKRLSGNRNTLFPLANIEFFDPGRHGIPGRLGTNNIGTLTA